MGVSIDGGMTDPYPPFVPPDPKAGFWTRSGTRNAIATTYALGIVFAHRWLESTYGLGVAVAFDTLAAAWGGAFGINAIAPAPPAKP